MLPLDVWVISKRSLFEQAARFPDVKPALQVWLDRAEEADWRSLEDIRAAYPATDMLGKLAIFNIRGNRNRLIARVEFAGQRIYIKELLTHAEYDKGIWKKWL